MYSSPRLILPLGLVLIAVTVTQAGFYRECKDSPVCMFKPKDSDAEAYLSCKNNEEGKSVCACDHYRYIMDAPAWYLDLSSDGKCSIARTGPCGEDDGLEIGCGSGNECIKGRCRDPTKVGKTPLNWTCYDDIDCQEDLRCKAADFQFHIIKRCVTPETPALRLG